MAGFYRSGYKSIEGASKVMVSTQFESLDARRCFPCWDEPAVKAIFEVNPSRPLRSLRPPCISAPSHPLTTPPLKKQQRRQVTLIIPRELAAFSNMPELESREIPGKGKRLVRFAPTPLMSTYLLAFVVGEFDFVQVRAGVLGDRDRGYAAAMDRMSVHRWVLIPTKPTHRQQDTTKHGVTVRVYTPPGKAEEGRFSLRVATDALDLYDDFFAIPYPLPKLDMVRFLFMLRLVWVRASGLAAQQAGVLTYNHNHHTNPPTRWRSPSSRWARWRIGAS